MSSRQQSTGTRLAHHNRTLYIGRQALSARGGMVLIGCLAGLALIGCRDAQEQGNSIELDTASSPRPRLVILYIPCTVNKDTLSPYNDQAAYTPNLTRFAEEGLAFQRHHTEAGKSGIAYASVFTGAQADKHGVFLHPRTLDDSLYLIGEAFRDGGYAVHYYNNHPMAGADYGYAQGIPGAHVEPGQPMRRDSFKEVLKKINEDPEYRACIVVNFTVTHAVYSLDRLKEFLEKYPAEAGELTEDEIREMHAVYVRRRTYLEWNYPHESRRLGNREVDVSRLRQAVDTVYKSNISYLDSLFGELMDTVSDYGVENETLVAFTADHGETLSRENALFKWTHGYQLSPEEIVIPFLMRGPGIPAGAYQEVTRSVDILPTLAGFCQIKVPDYARAQFAGHDLSEGIRTGKNRPELDALFHSSRNPWDEKSRNVRQFANSLFPDDGIEHIWAGIRSGDSYMRYRKFENELWGFELYDMANDSMLESNLYDDDNPGHAKMAELLLNYRNGLIGAYAERDLSEADLEVLRSLGYVD